MTTTEDTPEAVAKPRLKLEALEQGLEVVRRQLDVAVQLDKEVVCNVFSLLQTAVEGVHDR